MSRSPSKERRLQISAGIRHFNTDEEAIVVSCPDCRTEQWEYDYYAYGDIPEDLHGDAREKRRSQVQDLAEDSFSKDYKAIRRGDAPQQVEQILVWHAEKCNGCRAEGIGQPDSSVITERREGVRPVKDGQQFSADGKWWWTGTEWVDASQAPVARPQLSPDGKWWWNGSEWVEPPGEPLSLKIEIIATVKSKRRDGVWPASDFNYYMVGESHHQEVLRKVSAGRCERGDGPVLFRARLRYEINADTHQPAIRIEGDGKGLIGYVPATEAAYLAPQLQALEKSGRRLECMGLLYRGNEKDLGLKAWLNFDPTDLAPTITLTLRSR